MNPQKSPYADDPNSYFWDWCNDLYTTVGRKRNTPILDVEQCEAERLVQAGTFDTSKAPDGEFILEFFSTPDTTWTLVVTDDGTRRPLALVMENNRLGAAVLNHVDFTSPDWE